MEFIIGTPNQNKNLDFSHEVKNVTAGNWAYNMFIKLRKWAYYKVACYKCACYKAINETYKVALMSIHPNIADCERCDNFGIPFPGKGVDVYKVNHRRKHFDKVYVHLHTQIMMVTSKP